MMKKRLLAVFAVAVLAVAGCAGLPTSGSTHQFGIEVPDREPLDQYGTGPQEGSTPEQLISDFMRACAAGSFDDYLTAKRYLLPQAASTWQPTSQVTIFPTDHIPAPSGSDDEGGSTVRVSVEVPSVANLDQNGSLQEFDDRTPTSIDFRLAKDSDGEWRIAALHDGLILSQTAFTTGFSEFDLYFASVDGQTLVSDPKWVPRHNAHSHLAQGLLAGPPESLTGAVMPNLMDGLTLPTTGVEVTKGVAHVELQGQAPVGEEARRVIEWQFSQTLRQSSSVQVVTVAINGVLLDAGDEPAPLDYSLDRIAWFESGALNLGTATDHQVVAPAETVGQDPSFTAIGPLAGSPLAWLDGPDTVRIMRQFVGETQAATVTGASRPSIDRWGNVWTTSSDNQGEVQVIGQGQDPVAVDTGLADKEIKRVAISPDGARIAVIAEDDSASSVWIGTLITGEDTEPIISDLVAESRVDPQAIDIAWADSTTLLSLTGEKDRQLKSVPVGGFVQKYQAPEGVQWVSSGTKATGWILQREDQASLQRVGATWRALSDAMQYISSPG